MPSDYYIVLGIERGANPPQIKRAYRQAIKRYHPDIVGSSIDLKKFREAREAYEVLSDIDKRCAYDAELKRQGMPVRITNVGETIGRRTEAWDAFKGMSSFEDDFFEGFVPGFFRPHHRAQAPPKDLYLEVILSPEEASRGGIFPVTVPVMEPCPDCNEAGWWEEFYCPLCLGHGAVKSTREFKLTIPPDVRDGMQVEVPMDGIGLPGAILHIDVRVEEPPYGY